RRWPVLAGAICLVSAAGVTARSWPWLALGLGLLAVARASAAWRTPAVLALVAAVTWALWAWNPASFTRPLPHRFARRESPYPPEPPRASGLGAALARRCGPEPARVLAPGLIWDGAAITERVELVQGYPESIAPGRMERLLGELGLDPERSLLPDWERVGARGRLLDLLNVGCVLVPAGARPDAERRARVDGQEAPVYRADYVAMAVPIAAGAHRVVLRYGSRAVHAAAALSALALVATAGLLVRGGT